MGFDVKRLSSVLRAIIRDLRKGHPGIGRVRIPSTLGGPQWNLLSRPKVLEECERSSRGLRAMITRSSRSMVVRMTPRLAATAPL